MAAKTKKKTAKRGRPVGSIDPNSLRQAGRIFPLRLPPRLSSAAARKAAALDLPLAVVMRGLLDEWIAGRASLPAPREETRG